MNLSISKTKARQFLLQKQLLYSPQSLSGKGAVEDIFNRLRLIQYDPLNPCGRNADLVLQARIFDYHPNDYYRWLYYDHKGIEVYDKELCIVPIDDFPLTDLRRVSMHNRQDTKSFLKNHHDDIENLLQFISRNGPVSSSDLTSEKKVVSGWGTEATFARVALEILWRLGRLTVVKRENGKKYYDLLTKHPASFESVGFHQKGATEAHVLRRLQSVGMLPMNGGGGGWQGLGPVRKVIRDLVEKEQLIEVGVQNSNRVYVIAREDGSFFETPDKKSKKKMVFLAPLDNLMWDRDMILDFFDFHYRWEVYTPVSKRKFGYYVLPILYGDEFIGRIEPVLKKDKILEIKGLWREENSSWESTVKKDFDDALSKFAIYLNAKSINNPFSTI